MQTRKSKCTNIYANHFYQNINASLCRAFKQITSQNEHKVQNELFYCKGLLFFYIISGAFYALLCLAV